MMGWVKSLKLWSSLTFLVGSRQVLYGQSSIFKASSIWKILQLITFDIFRLTQQLFNLKFGTISNAQLYQYGLDKTVVSIQSFQIYSVNLNQVHVKQPHPKSSSSIISMCFGQVNHPPTPILLPGAPALPICLGKCENLLLCPLRSPC